MDQQRVPRPFSPRQCSKERSPVVRNLIILCRGSATSLEDRLSTVDGGHEFLNERIVCMAGQNDLNLMINEELIQRRPRPQINGQEQTTLVPGMMHQQYTDLVGLLGFEHSSRSGELVLKRTHCSQTLQAIWPHVEVCVNANELYFAAITQWYFSNKGKVLCRKVGTEGGPGPPEDCG